MSRPEPPRPARTFAVMVRSNPTDKKLRMQYYEPTCENGVIVVEHADEVIDEACSRWSDCLFGYFIGKKLNYKSVSIAVRSHWGKYGLTDILSDEMGVYHFRIPDYEDRMKILEAGMWLMWDRPCLLQ
ncbi:hypothetical protein Droror1_Dr00000209 [Drosera rotundifolia]